MHHELETGEVAQLVQVFAAADVGFKVLEVHGVHDYLIQTFLLPFDNKRNDTYGDDIQSRIGSRWK